MERSQDSLLIRYRRPNGKESRQRYDLAPVSDEGFRRACHHSQNLLRRPFVERLLPYPATGELAHWEYDRERSCWSLPTGLVEEEPAADWVERIAQRSGLGPALITAAFTAYAAGQTKAQDPTKG